jgi:hypothetical protein
VDGSSKRLGAVVGAASKSRAAVATASTASSGTPGSTTTGGLTEDKSFGRDNSSGPPPLRPNDWNAVLAAAARRPKVSTKKLEREIANRERQIARIRRNLEEMEGDVAIRAIIRKVSEMEADLEALKAELIAERRRNHSPPVTRIKEKDVLLELNRLRDVLLSDVGAAASVLAQPVHGRGGSCRPGLSGLPAYDRLID